MLICGAVTQVLFKDVIQGSTAIQDIMDAELLPY